MFVLGIMYLIKKTGHLGKVIGYGHQIVKSGYQTTLKVLVVKLETSSHRGFIEEDLYSAWVQWAGTAQYSTLAEGWKLND